MVTGFEVDEARNIKLIANYLGDIAVSLELIAKRLDYSEELAKINDTLSEISLKIEELKK